MARVSLSVLRFLIEFMSHDFPANCLYPSVAASMFTFPNVPIKDLHALHDQHLPTASSSSHQMRLLSSCDVFFLRVHARRSPLH